MLSRVECSFWDVSSTFETYFLLEDLSSREPITIEFASFSTVFFSVTSSFTYSYYTGAGAEGDEERKSWISEDDSPYDSSEEDSSFSRGWNQELVSPDLKMLVKGCSFLSCICLAFLRARATIEFFWSSIGSKTGANAVWNSDGAGAEGGVTGMEAATVLRSACRLLSFTSSFATWSFSASSFLAYKVLIVGIKVKLRLSPNFWILPYDF